MTAATLWSDFAPYAEIVSEGSKAALRVAALQKYANVESIWELPCGLLAQVFGGDDSWVPKSDTALAVLYVQAVADMRKQVGEVLQRFCIEPTAKERQWQNGCIEMTAGESIMVFVRRYFGLQSFKAAEKISVGEYIVARHEVYNDMLTQRNYNEWAERRAKQKRR